MERAKVITKITLGRREVISMLSKMRRSRMRQPMRQLQAPQPKYQKVRSNIKLWIKSIYWQPAGCRISSGSPSVPTSSRALSVDLATKEGKSETLSDLSTVKSEWTGSKLDSQGDNQSTVSDI